MPYFSILNYVFNFNILEVYFAFAYTSFQNLISLFSKNFYKDLFHPINFDFAYLS